MDNPYASLGFNDTMCLICARTKALNESPTQILEHIGALIELAKHFDSQYTYWHHQHMKEQIQQHRAVEEMQRQIESETAPKTVN